MSDVGDDRSDTGPQWWELGGVMRSLRWLNGTGEFAPSADRSSRAGAER